MKSSWFCMYARVTLPHLAGEIPQTKALCDQQITGQLARELLGRR